MLLDLLLAAISLLIVLIGGYVTFWPPANKRRKIICFGALCVLFLSSFVIIVAQARNRSREQKNQEATQNQLREQNLQLQSAVDRVLLPIKDLSVTFRLDVPLDHPDLKKYRERLENCVREMVQANSSKCGVTIAIDPDEILHKVCIPAGTELNPRLSSETVAYFVLNTVSLNFKLFKSITDLQSVANYEGKPDLGFRIHRTLDSPGNLKDKNVKLCYEIDQKTLYFTGFKVPIDPQSWSANGKLISIPDFRKITFAVHPSTYMPVLKGTLPMKAVKPEFMQESLTAMQISETTTLQSITLHMAGGYEMRLARDKLTLIKDKHGRRLYLSNDAALVH